MKRAALHNLGCKVNAYEMDIMQQNLQENGYRIVPFDEIADIYIVNTCTVTNIADRKSRQMLHQAKKRNPDAVVVAVGCYVQVTDPEALQKEGIDLAVGNNRKKDLIPILNEFLASRHVPDEAVTDVNAPCDYEEMTLKHTAEHTRAFIKIQDGCNQFCSYCIIPYARGRVRSRRYEDIRREMEGLAASGYKEVVLTGIHISSYGIDFDEKAWEQGTSVIRQKQDGRRDYAGSSRLIDLIEKLQDIEGIERIRLGSLEPRIVTQDAVRRMAALSKLCPHFHLSLQSGCDET
ncbi:MAG: radical SAM protein, partial [Lachnospiraceae bacterium]